MYFIRSLIKKMDLELIYQKYKVIFEVSCTFFYLKKNLSFLFKKFLHLYYFSARKRPVPYRRPSPPTPSSTSSWSYRSHSRSSSPVHPLSRSPISRCSSRSFRSHSQSWSPIIRPKCEIALNINSKLIR